MARRKARAEEPQRELTRKEHRIRAEVRERNRRLYIGVGAALALAFLIIVIGLVNEFVFRPRSAVATVGDTTITARDYWKRIYLEQNRYQNQLVNLMQLESQFGGQGFFTTQISQLQGILSSSFSLGVEVLDTMIRDEVVRQQAAARGITVSAEEVEQALREEVAAGQNAITVPQATATAEAAAEATSTAAGWTPTPSPTVDASTTVTATATPFPTPEPPPTRAILTDEQYSTGLAELEQNLREVAGMTLDEYRRVVEARLLNEKLAEAVGEELVAATEEQVHARHILINVEEPTLEPTPEPVAEGEPTPTPEPEGARPLLPPPAPRDDAAALALAQELRDRLLAGEDFAALAEEYSDDPGSGAQGGDLGWFGRGMMVAPFEEAAFSLEPGQVSEPVRTDFGYHLIEVIERDANRPKEEAALQQERLQQYDIWLQERVAEANVERPTDLVSKLPRNLELTVPQLQ